MWQQTKLCVACLGLLFVVSCSPTFDVIAGPAARLAFTKPPSGGTGGATITPAVQVTAQDTLGNTATGFTGDVTVALGAASAGGMLSGMTTVKAQNGVATFSNLSIDKAGTGYTLTAAATGLAGATSAPFGIAVGSASRLAFTVQPGNSNGGTLIAPVQVTAQDAGGNTATGFNGIVTLKIGLNPDSGTLAGTASVTAVNGVATFTTLGINKAATGYTLTATASGLAGATSKPFDVTVGPAVQLVFTGQPSNANAGAAIAPAVQVTAQDAGGNTVTSFKDSVTVALDSSASGATLSGTTRVAAIGGVATFPDLAIQTGGARYTLRAISGTLTSTVSTAFAIAAVPTPLHITTSTTGAAVPAGYSLCVDYYPASYYRLRHPAGCRWSGAIDANSAISVPESAGTSHSVQLRGVPSNCGLTGDTLNPRTVTVSGTTEVPFTVACLDTGSVHLTVASTGADIDADGYYVCVSRSGSSCYWSTRVQANDVITIGGVTAETHTVTIGDVVPNCTATGDTTRVVTVPAEGTVDVAYTFHCAYAERIAYANLGVIWVMRLDGLTRDTIADGFAPAWTADGTKLAYECGLDICVINADGTGVAKLTTDGANNLHPTWSPDGTKIAFSASHAGVPDLWVMAANGTGTVQLTLNEGFVGSPAWSPDGTKIAFDCQVAPANDDICVVNADGTGFTRLTSDPARDYGAAWKRDGTTLAFATTRYGADEIVLMSSVGGSVTRIGTGLAGSEPTWSPDGTHLGFVRLDQSGQPNILTAQIDGSNVVTVTSGDQPAWKPHP